LNVTIGIVHSAARRLISFIIEGRQLAEDARDSNCR
jgi:hypothetical protein